MHPRGYRDLLSALFVTTLVVSNIIAVKIGAFGGFYLPVAVVIFPLSYVLGDIITEVYGFSAMRRTIWTGFLCNLVAVAAIMIGNMIPAAPFFEGQDAYRQILGSTPRILGASFTAFLIGSFTNAMILSRLKVATKGKHLWLRTITSTVIGEGLDSLVFISLAFWGIFAPAEVALMFVTQWAFKVCVEILVTPLTYAVVGTLKKREGTDVYDAKTSFNPFRLS
ncbi:MAG: queuosine precursor transporter [Candidatus Peribacteraceae bacterium]|nr:queuosine precursor transporter [Candidatus Peribacteraceae bacterium]